jgi:Fe-Mn family superoxide dismutase
MKPYTPHEFNVPELAGISTKTVEEHIKLYQGYVKNANLIIEKIGEYMSDSEKNAYVLGELQRRFAFEFCGMRNHEYYFHSLEGGAKPLPTDSTLRATIESQAPSFDVWLAGFKTIALTRGIGWAILAWDSETQQLTHSWVDEQHLGQLTGVTPVLMLDMWEHSYLMDYTPSEKKKYVEAFFANLNWETIEQNFIKATA